MSRESKAHFGLPWVRPWDNRRKFYMDGKRIQCLSNAPQHVPIYLNCFPVIQPVSSKVHHFGTFWPPNGYTPGTTVVNVSWIEREFNAGQMHRSMCPSIFNRLRAIASYWSEIATFSYPLAFNAPIGGVPIGIPGKSLVLIKLDSWGYQAVKTVWR